MAEEYGFEYEYVPTTTEQKVISLLGIPTALLSIAGSSLIIHHVLHNGKKTPYRRILLGMSGCDIISTFGYVMQPFMSPSGFFNSYVWSFGNKGTCSALGAITQFAFSSHFYSAFLAFYFVCTIRYGIREDPFAKKYERWIHGFIWTWSIGTAIAGLVMDIFRANVLGPGCWINTFPEPCIPEEGCNMELIAWVVGGLPSMLSLICIIVCNLILYCFVRRTVKEGERKALEKENAPRVSFMSSQSFTHSEEDGVASTNSGRQGILRSSEKQWERVRNVGKQSFLYVSAYLICYSWSLCKHFLDGQNFDEIEGSGVYILPLLILQAFFLPAQGCMNAFIFFRPKFIKAKRQYKDRTLVWYLRRSVFGGKLKPSHTVNKQRTTNKTKSYTRRRSHRITFAGELVSAHSQKNMAAIPITLKIPQEEALRAPPSLLELNESTMLEPPTESMAEETQSQRGIERKCIKNLRCYCKLSDIKISDSLLFRFACFHGFDAAKAQEAIANSRQNEKYLNLKMNHPGLEHFFYRRILFPLPGLVKTKAGQEMHAVYFRPSRFLAAEPSHHKYVVECLNYVLNDLSRSEEESRTGVAVIINLAEHTDKNFHKPTMAKVFGSTEGKLVPTKVNLVIMVDAPPIFKPSMNFIKSEFSMDFAKKVFSVKSSELSCFFLPGYEEYLPSELPGGWRDIDEICEDYVDAKIYEDGKRREPEIVYNEPDGLLSS